MTIPTLEQFVDRMELNIEKLATRLFYDMRAHGDEVTLMFHFVYEDESGPATGIVIQPPELETDEFAEVVRRILDVKKAVWVASMAEAWMVTTPSRLDGSLGDVPPSRIPTVSKCSPSPSRDRSAGAPSLGTSRARAQPRRSSASPSSAKIRPGDSSACCPSPPRPTLDTAAPLP